MLPIYYVPLADREGRLAIVPRPRGGDWLTDDLSAFARTGVHVLVSLLEPEEQRELGLDGEAAACMVSGIQFVPIPVPDRDVPRNVSSYTEHVRLLVGHVQAGRTVAVHCRQSVGRAGMLAVAVAVALGQALPAAIEAVSTARGVPVPETAEQHAWLYDQEGLLATAAAG